MEWEISQEKNEKGGRFVFLLSGDEYGEMTYVNSGPGKFIIDHTFVNPELKGMGAGKKLLDYAVAYARENHLKIVPLCPFASKMMNRTPEDYADVLF
ncbi:MAG: GNAT family N-acetyltransferase [Bacteroidetes bacterium]|nr:GNAT family N-acetyltransferase [Bacteroidota bacterium]